MSLEHGIDGPPNQNAGTIDAILIEDHTIVREGLKLIIDQLDGIRLVGEAGNGREGLRLFKHLLQQPQKVDVVITDLGLPDISGIEVARRVKEIAPETAVLILSMYSDQEHIASILTTSVDGYLLKQSTPTELADAIRAVVRGGMALSPTVARQLVDEMHHQRQQEEVAQILSERELQVLVMLAHGATSKEIALDLDLSVNTIENHRGRILEKLDVVNTAAAIGRAYELGLMSERSNL